MLRCIVRLVCRTFYRYSSNVELENRIGTRSRSTLEFEEAREASSGRDSIFRMHIAGSVTLQDSRVDNCAHQRSDIFLLARNRAEPDRSIGSVCHWTLRRFAGSEPGSTDVLPPALSIHPPTPFTFRIACGTHGRACTRGARSRDSRATPTRLHPLVSAASLSLGDSRITRV